MFHLLSVGSDGAVGLGERLEEELPTALRNILQGGLWFPPQVIARYVRNVNALMSMTLAGNQKLTARENQILGMILRRLSNKDIGSSLDISERTVKFHVSNVLAKLQTHDRSSLIMKVGA